MKVPLLDLKPQNAALAGELQQAFTRVMESGQFILGPEVDRFEQSLSELLDVRHAIAVSSGTDAILLALMALGIGPGDEVICPSFTFFATAGCVARVGARPVFADSCPVCFNLDPRDVAHRITFNTKAIMPVHLYGQSAEMDPVLAIAEERGIPVIEDAAQALGGSYKGRQLGTMGAFGTYSFFPSKNMGAFGDAGLLVTNDERLAEQARLLRVHGARAKYFHEQVGGNFRIDALQAALLNVKLPHLQEYTRRRAANASYYVEQLSKLPGVKQASAEDAPYLSGTAVVEPACEGAVQIILPVPYPHNEHIWNQFTLRVIAGPSWNQPESPRDRLRQHLASREIGSEIYYPRPMHLQECFTRPGAVVERLPVSEQLSAECLSIPIFPDLTREQLDHVVSAIAEFA